MGSKAVVYPIYSQRRLTERIARTRNIYFTSTKPKLPCVSVSASKPHGCEASWEKAYTVFRDRDILNALDLPALSTISNNWAVF